MSVPYAYVSQTSKPAESGQLISEQIHHQTQIRENAFKLFQASRRYCRGLTRANIKVPPQQQDRVDNTGYQTSNKCTQITLSRVVHGGKTIKNSKAKLDAMNGVMQRMIERNDKLLAQCRKTSIDSKNSVPLADSLQNVK
mmetsp:Transcript_47517/g.76247  ORF Transcript_47517/g.76247 Transcript_47517/m.76247 type:complete len:140 (-) Transcript_47517:113-532(-)